MTPASQCFVLVKLARPAGALSGEQHCELSNGLCLQQLGDYVEDEVLREHGKGFFSGGQEEKPKILPLSSGQEITEKYKPALFLSCVPEQT